MNLQLEGKRALVTGSSSGIGAGMAKVLAAEGAMVVVHGRNRERANQVAEEIGKDGALVEVVIGELADDAQALAVAQGADAGSAGSISWSTTPVASPASIRMNGSKPRPRRGPRPIRPM